MVIEIDSKNAVTEEGILSYCFTLDDDSAVPESRSLRIAGPTITPAFFKKVVEVLCRLGLASTQKKASLGE